MIPKDIQRFYDNNPLLYGMASTDDLDQLSRICELYPDSARLLSDSEAIELPHFQCRRCGKCCSTVKYITVSREDVKRWVSQKRLDILEELVIDGLKTPLLALRKKNIDEAKAEARSLMDQAGIDSENIFKILYTTGLLECAIYVKRRDGACTFLVEGSGRASCSIQETKPGVCEKFPYYLGKYTDSRLIKVDSFCPSLRELAKKYG